MDTVREGPNEHSTGQRAMLYNGVESLTNDQRESLARNATPESNELIDTSIRDNVKIGAFRPPFRQPVPPFSPAGEQFHVRAFKTPGKLLQSVVTTSFSIEDSTLSPERYHLSVERRDGPEVPTPWTRESSREERTAPPSSIVVTRTSPGGFVDGRTRPPPISRSYSGTTIDSYANIPMKRNFFHHAQSNQTYRGLPPDFVPPKRSKSGPPRKREIVLSARPDHDSESRHWYSHAAPQWESHYRDLSGYPEDPISHQRCQSFPTPQHWSEQKHPGNPMILHSHLPPRYSQIPVVHSMQGPPVGSEEYRHEGWRHPGWYDRPPIQYPRYWESRQRESQKRDDTESGHSIAVQHEMRESFDEEGSRDSNSAVYSDRKSIFRNSTPRSTATSHTNDKMKLVVEAASFTEGRHDFARKQNSVCSKSDDLQEQSILLAMPEDKASLSETLCVVRENIEVFRATQNDVDAPAPGRKHAIVVGQVGLRCIHCRHTTKASERVKRAVCYPSSIKRIYRTVIDMKLDHFSQCKYVPKDLKQRLDDLKAIQTRSTGTTMQYFIKSAHALGMEDAPSGVRFSNSAHPPPPFPKLSATSRQQLSKQVSALSSVVEHEKPSIKQGTSSEGKPQSTDNSVSSMEISKRTDSLASGGSFDTFGLCEVVTSGQFYDGVIPLSLPDDSSALSPLRCFLRAQVCAFSATENDIAVRAPTTFSIAVGQVGIGCAHCVKQPPRLRSNRAVCFPFSIGRIYQSVADIQRFHLGECKNLPENIKEEFMALQTASSKGSKGLATRQYWVASAKKLGLVDTPKGIRFARDPSKPQSSRSFSLDILAQAAFSVTTTSKKLVLPEDKGNIAEFLYVVMDQLQPCRFTEADRNKRRLKDVGYIGVECKHCAGHVDSRKFFWSSVSAVESNFVSVHSHMFECKMVPEALKERLTELKQLRKEQTSKLMTGSQKSFFRRVWERLHDDEARMGMPEGQDDNITNDLPSNQADEDESIQKMEV